MSGKIRRYPFLALRGMVFFPNISAQVDVGRKKSIAAIKEAVTNDSYIVLSPQYDVELQEPKFEDVSDIGVLCKITKVQEIANGLVRISINGINRVKITDYYETKEMDSVEVFSIDDDDDSPDIQALMRNVYRLFEEWVKLDRKMPSEVMLAITVVRTDPAAFVNTIITNVATNLEDQITSLELIPIKDRLMHLRSILSEEIGYLRLEEKIGLEVAGNLNKLQKEHYLREQLKVIHKELGDAGDIQATIDEYQLRIDKGNYPEHVVKELDKQLKVLSRTPQGSPDMSVLQNYVECLLDLPWKSTYDIKLPLDAAEKILNESHFGMEKVKDRILEYIAMHKINKDVKPPILCLVGPPGVGKTSIATGIAKATNREFIRASLGGVKDEAEIRGHRRTYIGAMPGRIIEGLKNIGTNAPLFLLDEVDKMASDYRGDPVSALLEVLDPEQNSTFVDRYVGLAYDLSHIMWIITANDLHNIPRPLRDRMEIIHLSSYTELEKVTIAKSFLLKKIREENGFKASQVKINDDVIPYVIQGYTRESGVRELKRQLTKLYRKAIYKLVKEDKKSITINTKNYKNFLGKVIFEDTKAEKENQIGICNGLAWTEVGGTILPVEVSVLDGKGDIKLTGSLGDVMKESGQAALTYIRSRSKELGIDPNFYKEKDIHIHFPEGAIPKDGPSAGITMATAIISALSGKKVLSSVAMTGEITLRGRVLAIGGLKEKSLAAYREGIKTVFIPHDNLKDLDEFSKEVLDSIEFVPVKNMDEITNKVLVD